jgi:hypothetical protein
VHEGRQRLIEQNRKLDDVIKVGYDMENIAVGTKVELYKQGDQLERIDMKH